MTSPSEIGRFRILTLLGEGAMGRVYLGEDPDLERRVAIKVMTSSADEEARERFRHEARSIGQLAHPNIVQIHEFGFHGDNPYLVMEYLEGLDLEQWLASPRPLAARLVVLRDLCRAVDHAHQREVLHRDIKPSNVQVLPDGRAKLVDFGIARSRSVQLTATGVVLGTPEYLAPEILSDVHYSAASDLYAVSLLSYRTLAGQNPFRAQNLEACLTRILTHRAPPLAEYCPELPEPLRQVIDQGLVKDPEDRPEDLRALEQTLDTALNELPETDLGSQTALAGPTRRLPTASRDLSLASAGEAASETLADSRPTQPLRRRASPPAEASPPSFTEPLPPPPTARRRVLPLALVAALGLMLAVGWWWRGHDEGRPETTPPVSIGEGATTPSTATTESPPETRTPESGDPESGDGMPGAIPAEDPNRAEVANPGGAPVPTTRPGQRAEDPASDTAATTGAISTTPPPPSRTRPSSAEIDPAPPRMAGADTTTASGTTDHPPGAKSNERDQLASSLDQATDLGTAGSRATEGGETTTEPPPPDPGPAPSPEASVPVAEPVIGPTAGTSDEATIVPQVEGVSPTVLRRGTTTALTVRGSGFTDTSQAVFERGGQPVEGLRLQRVSLDRRGRLKILVAIPHTASLGPLTLRVAGPGGETSSPLLLEIGL